MTLRVMRWMTLRGIRWMTLRGISEWPYQQGERGCGVVATGGSDGVLRLVRGGAVEAEAGAYTRSQFSST
jgi:hypothetical protein